MTSPGIDKPDPSSDKYDDVYTVGSRFGQDLDAATVESMLKGEVHSPFHDALAKFGDVLKEIGLILGGAIELGVGALQWIADGVLSIVNGIAAAIRGELPGDSLWSPVRDAFEDYQLTLKDRTDLIPLGYCSAYSDRNILLAALVGSATRIVPFNEQLGPNQGAHVGNESIVFDVTGTWTVHVMVGFRGVPPLVDGDGRVHIEVRVRHPDGSLASWWKVRGAPGRDEVSLTCSRPVVVTTPGMYVEVMARTGMTRYVDGGTAHSVLTVVRSSLDTDNPGVPEVPDE